MQALVSEREATLLAQFKSLESRRKEEQERADDAEKRLLVKSERAQLLESELRVVTVFAPFPPFPVYCLTQENAVRMSELTESTTRVRDELSKMVDENLHLKQEAGHAYSFLLLTFFKK